MPSKGVPTVRSYQRATMSTPSGLMEGAIMTMTLSRTWRNLGLAAVASFHANSMDVWVEATSSACTEHVMRTIVLPSAISFSASLAEVMRGSASRV